MTATTNPHLGQIHALLAERGYEVTEPTPDSLSIKEVHSGVIVRAVLEQDIAFFSLTCTVVPEAAVTPALMRSMLAADNGISTSYFQLYEAGEGKLAVTLNNFCKLLGMGAEDEDDILSAVHFLLADVMSARRVLAELEA
jgi:hypothetical protein